MPDGIATLRPCLPSQTPPLRTMVSIGGARMALSARTDRALIEAEQACARWSQVRDA